MTTVQSWTDGLQSEIDYWRVVFEGSYEPYAEYTRETMGRLDPKAPLVDYLAGLIPEGNASTVSILDVAAGPISSIGWTVGGEPVDITPIDALAAQYREILTEFGLTPPRWTLACDGEKLNNMFANDTFDTVHIRNALDHCYEPISVMRNILAVLKPGGKVFVCGHVDEAHFENYDGLHQWNVRGKENEMIIWRPGECFEVGRIFQEQISEMSVYQSDESR